MSKRKREHEHEWGATRATGQALKRQFTSFRATIDHANKDLVSALKLARGFERQKLGRRQKQASKEPHALLRLREEVIVLKQLDLEATASNHLLKNLLRAKRVRESRVFETVYGTVPQVKPVKSGAEANVIGRLFSSAPVKQVMAQIMETIYRLLVLPAGVSNQRVTVSVRDHQERPSWEMDADDDTPFAGFSESEAADDDKNSPHSAYDMEDALLESYQDRLAEWEGEDSKESSLNSENASPSPSPEQPYHTGSVTTSFLPTLGMAGYYSGSEPDEDDEAAAKPRKNRRGQRARQQLAELKYGKNAKHLQKQNPKDSRNAVWDAQRGAVDPTDRRKGTQRRKQVNGNSRSEIYKGGAAGMKQPWQDQRTRDDTGPLHPSWEAAKQRKSLSAGQTTFAGKKITFD